MPGTPWNPSATPRASWADQPEKHIETHRRQPAASGIPDGGRLPLFISPVHAVSKSSEPCSLPDASHNKRPMAGEMTEMGHLSTKERNGKRAGAWPCTGESIRMNLSGIKLSSRKHCGDEMLSRPDYIFRKTLCKMCDEGHDKIRPENEKQPSPAREESLAGRYIKTGERSPADDRRKKNEREAEQ